MPERLGDAPIEPAYREMMNVIARSLDTVLVPAWAPISRPAQR